MLAEVLFTNLQMWMLSGIELLEIDVQSHCAKLDISSRTLKSYFENSPLEETNNYNNGIQMETTDPLTAKQTGKKQTNRQKLQTRS